MKSPLVVDRAALMALAGDARRLNNPPGQLPPGAMAGERASKQQGRGLNFDSLRRYQPGDDVRLIDWQATARLRSPWIRLYNEERERPIFLLVDQRLDMYFATRGQSKSAVAATVAGLLAWRSWHDGDRLGCLVFNDQTCALTPCRSPKTSLSQLLSDLEHYNQQLPGQYQQDVPPKMTLTESLQRIAASVPTGSWLAIISDFHDLDARSEALLAGLRKRCEISAFVTLDDLHLRLPAQGQLAAWYQDQQTTLSLSPELRNRIQDSVTARLASQENRLTRLGIKVNQIVVGEDLLAQLQKGL
ncbi:DUF58 domain-containing protein [Erwinia sp.]|uniref:DUF58 domain-containing protein n=1 Tax=Erwinia citreus TaxID=558 RepID=UPI003C721660